MLPLKYIELPPNFDCVAEVCAEPTVVKSFFAVWSKIAALVALSRSDVLVTAVRGAVGGVNAVVYRAVPFSIRRSEIYPLKPLDPLPIDIAA